MLARSAATPVLMHRQRKKTHKPAH